MNDKELKSFLYEYLDEHTITELMQLVLDVIEYKEEDYQGQINSLAR